MNGNNNAFYMNRIIKLISPITCQTFKIELNGEENELRELLATILEINPKSIKGLRDSNNYYTLSSAVKNPNINTDPYNYYTVVIKGIGSSNDFKYMKYPSFNIFKRDRINSYSLSNDNSIDYKNNFGNKTMDYIDNDEEEENSKNMRYFKANNNNLNNEDYYKKNEFLNFAEDLYKNNYIDYNLKRKLKKLIKENNKEVMSILNTFLNLKSHKNFDELAKKIKPVITPRSSQKSEILEESKQNSSSGNSISKSKSISKSNSKSKSKSSSIKEKKSKKNENNNKKKSNQEKNKFRNEEKILEDVKLNFSKDKYAKLKGLLEKRDTEIIKIIKFFEKNNDYNHLLSKLSRLVENFDNEDEEEEENISSKENENENDSSYYVRKTDNGKSIKNNKKNGDNDEMQKIIKKICKGLKNKGKDIYYIAKYDLQKLKNDDKMSLFTKQFKLNIDKISNNNYKIPKKNIGIIKNYYTDYIQKKICKNFNEDEKLIYNRLLEEDEENNILLQYFKELPNHQNINELKNQIKNIIKEAEERIEEEENEEDDDENKNKNSIKEENEENEDEEDEEEEDDAEGEEEEEDEEKNKDSENKSKESSSNKDTFILKDGNKDRAANILNNNYKKINNFNNFANNNNNENKDNENNNNDDNEKKEENNDDNNQNLGLGFVVVKQKKQPNKEEEKKDSGKNFQNNNGGKLVSTNSLAKESSVSTNNPNKKLKQFITQIEHMKKIDDIKKTIIDAINSNNKYVMDLFEKFQKNKFNLNPKSLNAVYKQIKDNPDTNSKDYVFKTLIKDIPVLNDVEKEFLCDEFTLNKNSELETYFNLYESSNEKDEFIESIQMFMNKPNFKKNLIKFSLKKIKSEISSNLLTKTENDNNEDLVTKSKEIIKYLLKYNLINEKEYNIIMNSLENNDDVYTATFQVLFDNQDLNDFYETMTIALEQIQNKKEGNQINDELWDNDKIKKNNKELKKRIEEKQYNTLEELYKNKNENLYNILKDLNSSNINEKVENIKMVILKKELSVT